MNSPETRSSPSYKHLKSKHKCSPVELKEKMRKDYKDKVKNCRNLLINQLRGPVAEADIRNTLTEIYKSIFNFTDVPHLDESDALEEIKNELVQEELEWWREEYEKSEMNIDWSSVDEEYSVICPVCEKINLTLDNGILSCTYCHFSLKTYKNLPDIKKTLMAVIEKHNVTCRVQFTAVAEVNETHIYIICESCMDMQLVL